MQEKKIIKVGKKKLEGFCLKLQDKNLLILRGSKGFVMCGYLNLSVANKFGEVAVKVKGVSTLTDVLKAKVDSCSRAALRAGIRKNQKIKDVIKIIA